MHESSNREAARKITRFRENILRRVAAECDAVTQSVAQLRERELTRFNADAATQENAQLEDCKRRVLLETQRTIESHKRQFRLEFYSQRERLRLELFDSVWERLADFARSPEYAAWLTRVAEPYRELTLRVRSCDAALLNGFTLELDDSVTRVGGFIAVGDGVHADETLERRLLEQEPWFIAEFSAAE
jgi:hypothetical protein